MLARAARDSDPPVALVLETADADEAVVAIRGLGIGAGDAVLVKGSRAVGLELVADDLLERATS